jgi:hypothetical protein
MNIAAYEEDLMWAGITPPSGRKTTCPKCSPYREKRDEKCLGFWHTNTGIRVECYHCGWMEEFV